MELSDSQIFSGKMWRICDLLQYLSYTIVREKMRKIGIKRERKKERKKGKERKEKKKKKSGIGKKI